MDTRVQAPLFTREFFKRDTKEVPGQRALLELRDLDDSKSVREPGDQPTVEELDDEPVVLEQLLAVMGAAAAVGVEHRARREHVEPPGRSTRHTSAASDPSSRRLSAMQ